MKESTLTIGKGWKKKGSTNEPIQERAAGNRNASASPLKAATMPSNTFLPFFLTVEINPRVRAKALAPASLLKQPEIFCLALGILISRSARLLVKGTSKSSMNSRVSCSYLARRLAIRRSSTGAFFDRSAFARMVRYNRSYSSISACWRWSAPKRLLRSTCRSIRHSKPTMSPAHATSKSSFKYLRARR